MNKEEAIQEIRRLETMRQNPNLPPEQLINIEKELSRLREIENNIFQRELQLSQKKTSDASNVFTGIVGLPLAFFLRKKPGVIEEEKEYKKIENEFKKPFEKQSGKQFFDYVYGSLDDPNTPSLHKDVLSQIKKYRDLYETYEKDKENPELKQYKNYKKYRDLIEKYSKQDKAVYKKTEDDPAVLRTKLQIQNEIESRFGEAKNSPTTGKYISTVLEPKRWEEFVERYPEKARSYAEKNEAIKKAYEKWDTEQKLKGTGVNFVENKLHRPPDISQQEAEQKLAAATKGQPLKDTQKPATTSSPSPKKEEERSSQSNIYDRYNRVRKMQERFNNLQKWWSKSGNQSFRNITSNTRGFLNKGFSRISTKGVNVVNSGFRFFSGVFRGGVNIGGRLGGLFSGGGAGGSAVAGGATAGAATGGGAAAATAGGAAATSAAAAGGGAVVVGAGVSAPVWGIIALIIAVILIILIVIFKLAGDMESKPGTGGEITGNCPTQAEITANRNTTPETCQYLNPAIDIFGNLTEQQIAAYIDKYWHQSNMTRDEFGEKVSIIVMKARQVGLNPVIFLGYWKSESLFGEGFGCPSVALNFNAQIDCATGISVGGSRVMQCASPNNPYKLQGCRDIKSIILSHPDIYDRSLFNFNYSHTNYYSGEEPNPILTFDAMAEGHGPRSPNLSREEGVVNRNCLHTYNILLEIALEIGACTTRPPGSNLGSCKFTRAGESKSYQSNKLLSYFQEVSGKTGIPAPVLAALVRVESTTNDYSISDYTDDDITTIESRLDQILTNIDAKIDATQKAICPASLTGALGLTQVQPSPDIIEQLKTQRPDGNRLAHSIDGVKLGASFAGKSYESLTLKDYCDPLINLYLGAGVILNKLGAINWNTNWNTQEKMRELGKLYYGASTYQDDKGNTYYYGDDLWNGLSRCNLGFSSGSAKIVDKAAQIVGRLTIGEEGLYSRYLDEPGVFYWCTYLITDSYNGAGYVDLSRTAHGYVPSMQNYFGNQALNLGKYQVMQSKVDVRQLRPGDVVFLNGGSGREHVTLIKDVNLEPTGSGTGVIHTYESNGFSIEDVIFVRDFKALNQKNTSYPITGFGQAMK